MADYRKYGFCGVVAKPYKTTELSRMVNEVINNKGTGLCSAGRIIKKPDEILND